MTRLLPALLGLLLLAAPVAASEDHVDYIDGVLHEAMAELDATVLDEATPPMCRAYADRLYLLLHLLEELSRRPHSVITAEAYGSLLGPVVQARAWCREAI